MKTIIMVILLAAFSASTSAANIKINENFKTDYYLLIFPQNHQGPVEDFMNDMLEPYQCSRGRLTYKILKEFESSWFGKDKPGVLEWNFKATCFETTLKEFKFGFEPAGYDEDYSQIIVQLKTAKGTQEKRFCMYATRTSYTECYKELPRLKTLSIPGKN